MPGPVLVFMPLIILLILNVPIAFAIGLASIIFLLVETHVPIIIIAQRLYLGANSFTLLAVPLFVLVGVIMNKTGLADYLVDFAMELVGFITGGLAAVNVVASMFFAGVSGSAMADTAAVGGTLIPQMIKRGYSRGFSGAITASSSTIGIIIPPSVPLILYGIYMEISVSTLFIAGILPGILVGTFQIGTSYVICKRRNYEPASEKNFNLKKLFETFLKALPALMIPVIILGGIVAGIFTPTEAAGIAVGYCLILAFVTTEMNLKILKEIGTEAVLFSGIVMIIIATADLLGWVMAHEQIPQRVVGPILGVTENPILFLWIASIVLILGGTILHGTAMLVILVPLLHQPAMALGIDPLHFAMVVLMCWGIGQQTPPVGSALYISCSLADVDVVTLMKDSLPFIGVLVFVLALIIFFPEIVYILPRLSGLSW